ncbi:TetR/AcrR family transcriptional regulator [Eggerthella guodeyinii]|uniref:TetR/AcrR family transcriptional regulator n=2 Tax=Eggerthella TaxID=84111 RepID=A0A6L7ITD7_9ACTN|nr:TetR/AcrR family transcriptional regulator [Eggerthella guodeyinii]MBC5584997.1 TetR/AcrR family transcriptional regulator [Eggerthella hominis]QOS67440.1 TetR/AcrR family transcriptional regulator [Eggerthella guodeyinii]
MVRTVKDPEERKRDILETAMELFVERGYEAVSMRDISHAAGITPGLCYHYFDSKQKLFSAALEAYAEECCRDYLRILDDASISLTDKIDALFSAVADEGSLRYHEFFHEEGNREFHRQLGFELCDRIRPHMVAALKADARKRGVTVASPEVLVDFITHGQMNILTSANAPDPEALALVRSYVYALLDSQTAPLD